MTTNETQTADRTMDVTTTVKSGNGPEHGMTDQQRERAARYCDGYRHGERDAWYGMSRDLPHPDLPGADAQYASGYRAGHAWGQNHPGPYGRAS
jgi:hypothetical protein